MKGVLKGSVIKVKYVFTFEKRVYLFSCQELDEMFSSVFL